MQDGIFRRRRLPHWDVPDATFFITSCLAGSISAHGFAELRQYRSELDFHQRPSGLTPEEWELRKHKLAFAKLDELLDGQPAVRYLERDELATVVVQSIQRFDGTRYDSLAYVVMPSHIHWVFRARTAWWETQKASSSYLSPRECIMQGFKSYTAHACNQLLGTQGAFWQDESYDHVVRDDRELERIVAYVRQNPVKARLVERAEDWKWLSARNFE